MKRYLFPLLLIVVILCKSCISEDNENLIIVLLEENNQFTINSDEVSQGDLKEKLKYEIISACK